eukprot:TRINITY_DN19119_c0_g2_i1.p1 TRINITY_DN19119_c0_g2~~TRINITY_DN19119_c0_g2_i1.p1  ORF type:complete len:102 (+),score=8.56 TRINITY_DN19119_c0_g2_i1:51-356(+)
MDGWLACCACVHEQGEQSSDGPCLEFNLNDMSDIGQQYLHCIHEVVVAAAGELLSKRLLLLNFLAEVEVVWCEKKSKCCCLPELQLPLPMSHFNADGILQP